MNKAFNKVPFQNYPSTDTPLDREHLNPILDALDIVDDRVVEFDRTKATKTEVQTVSTAIENNKTAIEKTVADNKSAVDKSIKEINAKLDTREENMFETATGTALHLADTHKGKAELTDLVHNLLPYPYADTTKTINGITFTDNGDGSITVKGTATAEALFLLKDGSKSHLVSGKTYTLSGTDGNAIVYINDSPDGTANNYLYDRGNGVTFDAHALYDVIRISVEKGKTVNAIIKPMLVKGATAHPYVSPTYEIASCGKNLFDKSKAQYFKIVSRDNGQIIDNNNTYAYVVNALSNTEYYFSGVLTSYASVVLLGKNKEYIDHFVFSNGSGTVKTTTETAYIGFNIGVDSINSEVMICLNSQGTNYEPPIFDYAKISPTTDRAFISTYDGETNIISPTDVTVNYGATEFGADIINYMGVADENHKQLQELTSAVLEFASK